MEHQFFKDRLSAYFDNELKNEEHAIVQQHIEGCNECQVELKQLEKIENLFSNKTELSGNDYWETSAQKIESALEPSPKAEIVEIVKPKSKGLWWKLTGVAASLALVALFTLEEKKQHDDFIPDTISNEVQDIYAPTPQAITIDSFKQETVEVTTAPVENEIESDDENETVTNNETIQAPQKPTVESQPTPQPVQKTKKRIVLNSASKEQTPTPAKEKLRFEEFENGGVQTSNGNIDALVKSEEQDADISIRGGRSSAVELSDADSIVNALSEKVQQSKDRKSARAKSSSLVPDSEENYHNVLTTPQESISQKGITKNSELNYWRRKVTENKERLKLYSKKSVQYLKPIRKDASKKKNKSAALDIGFTYKQIFEGYYHVALLTNDSLEEKQAIGYLTKYADSLTENYSSNALYYLQLYKTKKTEIESRENK